jgi:hypothetical protein
VNGRLKRVTDLFVEGTELYLGDDESGPIVIWINKLNSFEVEDVRRDALVRRGERLAELGQEDSPERRGVLAEMALWSDEKLIDEYLDTRSDERYLQALDDLAVDPKWRDLLDRLERAPALHDAEGVPEDDPRREALKKDNALYEKKILAAVKKLEDQARKDLEDSDRKDIEKSFLEQWRQHQTLNEFMQARRHAELFYVMRQCKAIQGELRDLGPDLEGGGWHWDHSPCDHTQRYLDDRREVRDLPDRVITRVIEAIDDLRITDREAGNSVAPRSSSESLEQSSAPEVPSTPSSPEETPLAVATT